MNRTTNERFSKKNMKRRSSTVTESQRTESTGSSLLSGVTMYNATEVINEMGAPVDYDGCFSCCKNAAAICCQTTVLNQRKIYDNILATKDG